MSAIERWKRLMAGALLLVGGLFLGGCAGDKKRMDNTDKAEVRWYIWAVPETEKVYREMADAFEAENSDIRIKLEAEPWSSYSRKLLTMMAGGTAPDVFTTEYVLFYPCVAKGQVLSLDKYIAKDKSFAPDDFFPQTLEACKVDGRLYALPKEVNVLCMYYNKKLFDAAGMQYPADGWTWQDFLQKAKAIAAIKEGRNKNFGFYVYCKSTGYLPWILQNNGSLFDSDNMPPRYANLDSPAVQEALQFLVDLICKHHVAPTASEEQGLGDIFANGRLGMMSAWMTSITRYEKQIKSFEWDVAPLPANKKRANLGLVLMYAISSQTKHPEEAYRFTRFLAGEKAQKILAESGMAVPVLRSVAESPAFIGEGKRASMMSKIVDSIAYADFNFTHVRALPNMQEIGETIDRNLELAFMGKKSVKDACLGAKKEADKLIAEERSRK